MRRSGVGRQTEQMAETAAEIGAAEIPSTSKDVIYEIPKPKPIREIRDDDYGDELMMMILSRRKLNGSVGRMSAV